MGSSSERDGHVSEQAQVNPLPYNEGATLSCSSEIFGIEGFNSFNFNGREIPITTDDIEVMLGLFLEENQRRERLMEEAEKRQKEDDKKARKEQLDKEREKKEQLEKNEEDKNGK
uniref:Uncharacterized protein n=1 Tax=Cucumis sativus TaxID=3659 RepID=A0A0A0LBL2_CUCSA